MQTYIEKVRGLVGKIPLGKVREVVGLIKETQGSGGTVWIVGNGGSLAQASHLANDLMLFGGVRSIALGDPVNLSAFGNDFGFSASFEIQLQILGKKGDLLIAISTSGRSENVLQCVDRGDQMGIKSVGLSGSVEGILHQIVDVGIVVRTGDTAMAQDVHGVICHLIARGVGQGSKGEYGK